MDEPDFTKAQLRYLRGPILVFNGAWGESLPDWLQAAVPEARLRQLIAEGKGLAPPDCCSLEEATLYLYTAGLTLPLGPDWARIYLWAAHQVLKTHGRPAPEDAWSKGELNEMQKEDLEKLRREIRRKVESKSRR